MSVVPSKCPSSAGISYLPTKLATGMQLQHSDLYQACDNNNNNNNNNNMQANDETDGNKKTDEEEGGDSDEEEEEKGGDKDKDKVGDSEDKDDKKGGDNNNDNVGDAKDKDNKKEGDPACRDDNRWWDNQVMTQSNNDTNGNRRATMMGWSLGMFFFAQFNQLYLQDLAILQWHSGHHHTSIPNCCHKQLLMGWKEGHNEEGQRDGGDDKQGHQGDNEGAGMTMEWWGDGVQQGEPCPLTGNVWPWQWQGPWCHHNTLLEHNNSWGWGDDRDRRWREKGGQASTTLP